MTMQDSTTNNSSLSDSGLSAILPPVPANASLAVLERLARAVDVPFNLTEAARALRQAKADIPPTASRAARQRLSQAAEAIGLQILTRQYSVLEALRVVEAGMPLAAFSVSSGGSARWHLLVERRAGMGRLARLMPGDTDEFLTPAELARRIGVADPNEVVEWLIGQPAAPLAEVSHPQTPAAEARHGPRPLTRLLGMLRIESRDIWIVVAYSIGIGLLSLATPLTAMALVNAVALTTLQQPLIVLCLILLVSLGLAAFLRILQTLVVEYMQRRIFVRVVADLAYRLPRVRREAFDHQHGPELVNRFFDVLTVQKASATLLLDGVAVVLQTSIGLLLLAFYHQILLGFDLVLIAGLLFIILGLGRGAVDTAIRESRAKYAVASWIEEMARHPVAFKLNTGPRYAVERADLLAREYLQARRQHFRIVLRQWGFALALQVVASTALLGLGGYLVIKGQLTLGQLVAAEIIVTLVVASFTKIGKHLENYYDLLAAVEKLGHLIDLPLERDSGIAHHARDKGATVRMIDLCFTYEGGRRPVLDNFNLTLEAGERVALLGPNGAGKSTLVDLLFGLRAPTHGRIEIDGTDLRDLRLESLREHTAVVKGIEVFEGTVLENIRMGRDELSLGDVQHALRAVDLLEEILALPEGLQTQLGTGGAPLSLGQAERLMLARAIAGQPRLLVLDEVLDDMDEEVRQAVLPAILGREARWTLLVITHSQYVARLCDRAVRMERPRSELVVARHTSMANT